MLPMEVPPRARCARSRRTAISRFLHQARRSRASSTPASPRRPARSPYPPSRSRLAVARLCCRTWRSHGGSTRRLQSAPSGAPRSRQRKAENCPPLAGDEAACFTGPSARSGVAGPMRRAPVRCRSDAAPGSSSGLRVQPRIARWPRMRPASRLQRPAAPSPATPTAGRTNGSSLHTLPPERGRGVAERDVPGRRRRMQPAPGPRNRSGEALQPSFHGAASHGL